MAAFDVFEVVRRSESDEWWNEAETYIEAEDILSVNQLKPEHCSAPYSSWSSMQAGGVDLYHCAMEFEDATGDDLPLLLEMAALFNHGPDAVSVEDWKTSGDVGIIGLADDDRRRVGAAWYRQHRIDGAPPGFFSPRPIVRAVFIGVTSEEQRHGRGTALLAELIRRAFADRTVSILVAAIDPANEVSVELFRRRGFTKGNDDLWTLNLERRPLDRQGRTRSAE
jgi:ribosomal protein S18 acetylase RimI-like enzyme